MMRMIYVAEKNAYTHISNFSQISQHYGVLYHFSTENIQHVFNIQIYSNVGNHR